MPAPDIQRIADRFEPEVRKAFIAAVEQLRRSISLGELEDLLETGRLAEAVASISSLDLSELQPILTSAALESGLEVSAELGFTLKNERAIQWARDHAARLVTNVTSETRQALRDIIVRAQREGLNIREQSKLIRDVVGLTRRDALRVDRVIAGMVEDDVSRRLIDSRREQLTDQLLRRRAENIARTETIRASNMGTQLGWRQAQDEGLLPQNARKVWIATEDSRTCPICFDLDGKVVEVVGGQFNDEVQVTTHRTPPAHPSCRCSVGLVFD